MSNHKKSRRSGRKKRKSSAAPSEVNQHNQTKLSELEVSSRRPADARCVVRCGICGSIYVWATAKFPEARCSRCARAEKEIAFQPTKKLGFPDRLRFPRVKELFEALIHPITWALRRLKHS